MYLPIGGKIDLVFNVPLFGLGIDGNLTRPIFLTSSVDRAGAGSLSLPDRVSEGKPSLLGSGGNPVLFFLCRFISEFCNL